MRGIDFSAFVNVLYNYRKPYDDGRMPGRAEFIKIITDAVIPAEAIEDGTLPENPIYGYKPRMLQYIFNGDRHIDPDVMAPINRVKDLALFEEYFEDFSVDALEGLSKDISKYGFDVTPANVVQACVSIMGQLIEHIAAGLPETVSEDDYNARVKGRRLRDIPPSSIEYRDGHFRIEGETITIDMSRYSEEDADQTMRYVQALYEAYENKLKRKINADNIDTMPQRLQENYKEQNRAFFYADSVRHEIRELFDDGENEFSKLKEDEWTFIRRTYWRPYDDAFERLDAVLDKALSADLSSSVLANMRNLINNLAKMGICQILVNDGEIKSWVIEDD